MPLRRLKIIAAGLLCLLACVDNLEAFNRRDSRALSHFIMAARYDGLGNFKAAIKEYKTALRIDKTNAIVHLNLASALIKDTQLDEAIKELETSQALAPELVEPHALLALIYYSQNKADLAAKAYEAALTNAAKLAPGDIEIYKSLGLFYLQAKKFSEALGAYKLAQDLAPDDPELYFYLGNVQAELKDLPEAEKALRRALELAPLYHEAMNSLGYLLVENNQKLEEAGQLIRKALDAEPDNGAYVDSLGWLYFRQGKTAEAIEQLERAASLLADPVIFGHLGDAYFSINEKDKAAGFWQKSLELEPGQKDIEQKLQVDQ